MVHKKKKEMAYNTKHGSDYDLQFLFQNSFMMQQIFTKIQEKVNEYCVCVWSNKFLENVPKVKYLVMTLTDQNCTLEGIKSRLDSTEDILASH